MQIPEKEEAEVRQVCQAPHESVVEWQALQPDLSPDDPVSRWMSADPITVTSSAMLTECANRMANARIHRLIVVDNDLRVVGRISSMNLLKAMADSKQ